MLNRAKCACLLLGALIALPSGVMAQEVERDDENEVTVTIGDPIPGPGGERDGDCANFVSNYGEDGPRTGELLGSEGEMTLSGEVSGGGLGISGSASASATFPFGAYRMSDGETVILSCVTYTQVLD